MPNEAKHTPGPWGAATRQGSWDWLVYSEADRNIEICQMFHDGTDLNETGEANSRLASAAPELLAAVETFTAHYAPWMDDHSDEVEASFFARHTFGDLRSACAAIAKAKGKADHPSRPLAELANEGVRQGRAISASPRVWEYEGIDGKWRECRNADDACMWAEDGRRIREKVQS